MEAELYFSAYDALHQGNSTVRRLELRLQNVSSIGKIVWSSFDFMCGPEMKHLSRNLVQVTSSSSVSPVNLSGEEGSVNDAESLDSSMSTQSAQYEDIDDPLETDLTCAGVLDDTFLEDSLYHDYRISSRNAGIAYRELRYLDEFMVDSHYSKADSNCTVTESGIQESTTASRSTSASTTTAMLQSAENLMDSGDASSEVTVGPIDPMVGTPMELMNISTLLSSDNHRQSDDTTSRTQPLSNASTPGSFDDDVVSFLDLPIAPREDTVTDEVFVSKFVLAEQVFSTQLPSNPLMHKITVVPSRNLLIGSFIFSVVARDGNKTIHAISFLMSCCKQEWYLERQPFLESAILDAVPKIKAAILVVGISRILRIENSKNFVTSQEDWDDVVVRINAELTRLMHLMTVLDRHPLVSESRPLLIKNTLLTGKRCHHDKVLCKAISGVLQSQGYCVIIGSDTLYVSKLLNTLAAFIPEEVRFCCLRMYRHKFSPYVRLQAVRRCELPYVLQCGALSSWPICVVDVDRATVCMSPPYSRHRILKQRADAQRVNIILDSSFKCKPVTLEMTSCRVLECVKTFLRRIDLLPLEESARMGLVKQLMLYVENMARALILYVQHASEPLPSEKASATKSPRFSLSECRRALDLQSDSWFHAVLARAELIMPDIAEFIYSSG
ncbi:unnamed protein product [Haemonchus placei]|uniref:UDENN FLCN/SMCR8-type domain-containing protein n=1 Tax=Haemonchus placei TaxID=6290 RepID=A0A0N4W584_HAEPC|nr:unnamed protein product [Haemonchus placei]